MRIGTSTRLRFTIDVDDFAYTNVKRCELTMSQGYKNILIRNLHIEEDCFFIDLSEEETYFFKPEKVRLQLKMVYPNGKVLSTCIHERMVKNVLNKTLTTEMDLPEPEPAPEDQLIMHVEEEFVMSQGTFDYNELINKPTINGTTLEGTMTLQDLGIVNPSSVDGENLKFS